MNTTEPRTWLHVRKGRLTGRIVKESDEWVTIELTEGNPNVGTVGEHVTVRASFLTEV